MIFGGLLTLIGGFLAKVLAWTAAAVGATLASLIAGLLTSTMVVIPILGPWLTMPWIPWLAIGHCTLAMFVGWGASLVISFVIKFGLPIVSMGWLKP